MDKFEKLLSEISQCEEGESSPCEKPVLRDGGFIRYLTISYEKDHEDGATFVQGDKAEDALAALCAVGNLLGKLTGLKGDEISGDLIKAAIKIMIKGVAGIFADDIVKSLEELVNG